MPAPKYTDAKVLQKRIDEYFAQWDDPEYKKPMTFSGFAYFMGFASRQSLWEYSKKDDNRGEAMTMALLRIEQDYEEGLAGKSPTGSIFALKNRGWKDRHEVSHSVDKTAYDELKNLYGS